MKPIPEIVKEYYALKARWRHFKFKFGKALRSASGSEGLTFGSVGSKATCAAGLRVSSMWGGFAVGGQMAGAQCTNAMKRSTE